MRSLPPVLQRKISHRADRGSRGTLHRILKPLQFWIAACTLLGIAWQVYSCVVMVTGLLPETVLASIAASLYDFIADCCGQEFESQGWSRRAAHKERGRIVRARRRVRAPRAHRTIEGAW